MKKLFSVMLLLVLVVLSGCQLNNTAKQAKDSRHLIICSSLGKQVTDALVQDYATKTGITVQVEYLTVGGVPNRLELLKRKKYDLWLGGTPEEFYMAAKNRLLTNYSSSKMAKLPPQLADIEGRWTPLYVDHIAFLSNKDRLDLLGASAPRDWEDLLQPVLNKELALVKPDNGGATYGMMTSLWQLRGQSQALTYAGLLRTQEPLYLENEAQVADRVYRGERAIGLLPWEYARQLEAEHSNLYATLAEDGNKNMVTAVAVLNTGSNEVAAKGFIDYLLSERGRNLLSLNGHREIKLASELGANGQPEGEQAILTPHDDMGWMAQEKQNIIKAWLNAR